MKTQTKCKLHQDQKYLVALVENDGKLIEEIYIKCSASISKMVQNNGGTIADAKDIFQESLISLYKQANEGFILKCPIENLLYLICKRRWLNVLRKRRITLKHENITNLELEDNSVHVHEDIIRLEARASMLEQQVKLLSPSCREIIFKSWSKNQKGKYFSWKEIADEFDLSYGYVRKKAAQCKARLIQIVKNDPDYKILKR